MRSIAVVAVLAGFAHAQIPGYGYPGGQPYSGGVPYGGGGYQLMGFSPFGGAQAPGAFPGSAGGYSPYGQAAQGPWSPYQQLPAPPPGYQGGTPLWIGAPQRSPYGQLLAFPTGSAGGYGLTPGGQGAPSGAPPTTRTPKVPTAGLMGPPSAYPSWLQVPTAKVGDGVARSEGTLRGDRFLVTRLSEIVEVKPAGEKAFFPLQFWKKVIELPGDSAVRSRSAGHALLTFADGTRFHFIGPCDAVVRELNEERLSVAIDSVDKVRISGGPRPTRVRMPEGSLLEFKGTEVAVDRTEEGLLSVRNFGPAVVQLSSETSEVKLDVGQRCELALALNTHPRPVSGGQREGLEAASYGTGVNTVRAGSAARFRLDGRTLMIDAEGEPTTVRWGGASFQLPSGARLALDPLGGRSFPVGHPPVDTDREKDDRTKGDPTKVGPAKDRAGDPNPGPLAPRGR